MSMEVKTKKNSKTTNLDNFDFSNKKKKINSPRSIEAVEKVGYTLDELYFLTLKQFKEKFPEVRNQPDEIISKRYRFFDEKRLMKIEEAKKERDKMIGDNIYGFDDISKSRSQDSAKRSGSENNVAGIGAIGGTSQKKLVTVHNSQSQSKIALKSTAIENEKKAFELIKKKQEMELRNLLQNELRTEMVRKEKESKEHEKRERDEKRKAEFYEKARQEEQKKRQKDEEAERIRKAEEKKVKMAEKERYEEEQLRMKEQFEKEKQRAKEARMKQEEEKRKQEEFRLQNEEKQNEIRQKAIERQKELALKDEQRKTVLEDKRIELVIKNQEKKEIKQKRLEITAQNLINKQSAQLKRYKEKEAIKDERLKHFELQREQANHEAHIKAERKNEEIKKALEKNILIEKERIMAYNQKQSIIQQKKEEIELQKEEEMRNKSLMIKIREEKLQQTLKLNENIINEKKSRILDKITHQDEKIKFLNEVKERENLVHQEEHFLHFMEKNENIRKIAHIHEYKRNKLHEKLEEKFQRIEDFQRQKNLIALQKREMADEIARKKQEYTKKFEKLFKGNIENINIEQLSKVFPGNNDIIDMISNFKSTQLSKINANRERSKTISKSRPSTSLGRNNRESNALAIKIKNKPRPMTNTKGIQTKDQFEDEYESLYENVGGESTSNMRRMKGSNADLNLQNEEHEYNMEERSGLKLNLSMENLDHKSKYQSQKNPQPQDLSYLEKDIQRNVDKYRYELNQELLSILSTEREKEDQREYQLAKTLDSIERKKLETKFEKERVEASKSIVQFNKEMEHKIIEYEFSLRK